MAARFFAWYGLATAGGALATTEKTLVGLAVAHAIPCVYCIEAYTGNALECGADLEQMTEAVQVAAATRAGSTFAHGLQMVQHAAAASMGGGAATVPAAYYDRGQKALVPEWREGAPGPARAADAWLDAVFAAGALSALAKRHIAVGVAHVMQCPYSIEQHTAAALSLGATLATLTEAVQIAAAIRGGAALVTGIQMVDQVAAATMGAR